jgi:dihydropteroate synthase
MARGRAAHGSALLGVCNVTPDSFSDGGQSFRFDDACARVHTLFDEGANVVDVGAESTRPGAASVSAAEQMARVIEVIRVAARGGPVSIDTASAEVADACLSAGACAVNDVSCVEDEALARVVAKHDAALIVMHSRGPQTDMAGFSAYPSDAYVHVLDEVASDLRAAAARAEALGVRRDAIVFDPGYGFAKNARQSFDLLASTSHLVKYLDRPVVIGASRKSFLVLVEQCADPEAKPTERIGASIAAAVWGARAGASMVRVHDVRATRQALGLEQALAKHLGDSRAGGSGA